LRVELVYLWNRPRITPLLLRGSYWCPPHSKAPSTNLHKSPTHPHTPIHTHTHTHSPTHITPKQNCTHSYLYVHQNLSSLAPVSLRDSYWCPPRSKPAHTLMYSCTKTSHCLPPCHIVAPTGAPHIQKSPAPRTLFQKKNLTQ